MVLHFITSKNARSEIDVILLAFPTEVRAKYHRGAGISNKTIRQGPIRDN